MTVSLPADDQRDRKKGRIITFYSYKGGTGRSMALANVAWILASNGRRVIVIDWDFEAPGLHRYFRPFLADSELSRTPGLIDFFIHFTEAASFEAREPSTTAPRTDQEARPWFYDRAELSRYAVSVDYDFSDGGVLDFVGAGKQGPSYGTRVNSFQWSEFYEKLGGGIFLEAMKVELRQQYEYILIDSRTGLSDTSGICTVQMPDQLVACFTLNRQSIYGAAATAASADGQRRAPQDKPKLKIWPVPMRVELHERDRLEAARQLAREQFASALWHVPLPERSDYWGSAEVLYFPYYAYEEVLATIADSPGQSNSLLAAMERVTFRLSDGQVTVMPRLDRMVREELLARYVPRRDTTQEKARRVFLSYASADRSEPVVEKLARILDQQFGPGTAVWSGSVPFGQPLRASLNAAVKEADGLIAVIGKNWRESHGSAQEVELALRNEKLIIPILHDVPFEVLPDNLRDFRATQVHSESLESDLKMFAAQLAQAFPRTAPRSRFIDPDDPHKGQFGGLSEHSGRRLSAHVSAIGDDWYNVELVVQSTSERELHGDVEFFLHPSFLPPQRRVTAVNNRALLTVVAFGAFTVGATADKAAIRLELDLATLSDAPNEFRQR